MMQLLALGLNHTTAPLSLREQVAFPGDKLKDTLADLTRSMKLLLPEAAILSTCNRMEIYCATPDPVSAKGEIAQWISKRQQLDASSLHSHLYSRPDSEAVRHAFRVAAGLDSMMIGEPQILGQMKEAARQAQDAGSLGTHLHQLFQRSFSVAKEIRSSTEIGAHSVSLAAVAVRQAKRIFEDLSQTKVLFIGAGEMIELTATHFAAQNPKTMVIANRTMERGELLAKKIGAQTQRLADIAENLHQFDIIVSCTSSTLPLIGKGMVESALKQRRRRPFFMVDLAVPRDIEPEVAKVDDVFLYTVDDLGRLVNTGVANRHAAVAEAEVIIDSRVQGYMQWLGTRQTVPLIKELHLRSEALKSAELAKAEKLLARGDDPHAVLKALANALTAKFLHGPTRLVQASNGQIEEPLQSLIDKILPPDIGHSSHHTAPHTSKEQ
jgi:glutamyl-tRNA reductase